MSILELMAAPFVECLVLVAIHTYFGIHVLKRRVIFVDLALAQVAALGTTVGFLFGIMPETAGALLAALRFARVLDAAVLAAGSLHACAGIGIVHSDSRVTLVAPVRITRWRCRRGRIRNEAGIIGAALCAGKLAARRTSTQ